MNLLYILTNFKQVHSNKTTYLQKCRRLPQRKISVVCKLDNGIGFCRFAMVSPYSAAAAIFIAIAIAEGLITLDTVEGDTPANAATSFDSLSS